MGTKQKQVSVNDIDKALAYNECNPIINTIQIPKGEDEFIEVQVKNQISFAEFNQLVYDIVSQCFQQEGDHKVFYASKADFVFRIGVIEAYTNLRISKNTEHLYKLAYSDIYTEIGKNISIQQYEVLKRAVREQLNYEKASMCKNYENKFNALIKDFNSVMEKLSALSEIDAETVATIINKLQSISEKDIIRTLRPELNVVAPDGGTN